MDILDIALAAKRVSRRALKKNWGANNFGKILAVGENGDVTAVNGAGAEVLTAGDVLYSGSTAYEDGTVGKVLKETSTDTTQLKSAITTLEHTVIGGENLINGAVILSNNNGAISNNNDGTYNVGTTDYGTTLFGAQTTLAVGRYLLYGVSYGFSFVSSTTSPNDAIIINSGSTPVEFELAESTSVYVGYRLSSNAAQASVISPFVKVVGVEAKTDYLDMSMGTVRGAYENITSMFNTGYAIVTNGSIGATVDITPVRNTGFASAIIPCNAGDKFTVTGIGGTNYLLWALADEDFKKLDGSIASAVLSGYVVTVHKDGYLIVNVIISSTYSLYASQFETADYRRVTNPHDLKWQMGTFTVDGVQTGSFNDRMYAICHVKAGSIMAAYSYTGVNIKVGYRTDDSTAETALDYASGFGYGAYKITKDATLYIGVLYNTPARIMNNSILDALNIALFVDDFAPRYTKSTLGNYGEAPSYAIYYEGQHTDTTGWTNASVDVDAIHTAYDALVTASNGYLTKKDLGEVWNGYHYYEYTTNPVGLHIAGLKVPKVLVTCEMHGNEKMSTYAMHYLLYDLIHNPQKNPVLSYLRANVQLVVIPITNPWGYINTSRWNENGVNLNRNFPTYAWADYDEGDDSAPGGINYKGTAAGSEPETKKMMDFINSHPDAALCIDLHTNGTDTSAWYEVTSTMLALTDDTSDPAYAMQRAYLDASKMIANYVKPWCDSVYGSDLGNVYYGAVSVWNDEPYISEWVTESTNNVGITYEVMAGSTNGYLGSQLSKYAPATIKCAAEVFGNYLLAMLHVAKKH